MEVFFSSLQAISFRLFKLFSPRFEGQELVEHLGACDTFFVGEGVAQKRMKPWRDFLDDVFVSFGRNDTAVDQSQHCSRLCD